MYRRMRYIPLLLQPAGTVIGRFFRDGNVVRVAFDKGCVRDAHKARFFAHLVDAVHAAVSHAGADPADHLIDDIRQPSAIRHTPFNALRHELFIVLLEITVVAGDSIPVIVLCELVRRAPDTPRRSRVKLAESRYRKVALSVCIILLVAAVIAGDTGPFIWLHPGRLVALSLAPLLALYFYSGCILPWDEG